MLVIDEVDHLLLELCHLKQLFKGSKHVHRHLPISII